MPKKAFLQRSLLAPSSGPQCAGRTEPGSSDQEPGLLLLGSFGLPGSLENVGGVGCVGGWLQAVFQTSVAIRCWHDGKGQREEKQEGPQLAPGWGGRAKEPKCVH